MKILITGAFGNVGLSVIEEALKKGHEVTVFEMRNKRTLRLMKKYQKNIKKIIFGDLRDPASVKEAVADNDAVIHLAAIIPPKSEIDKKLCYDVNVDCTRTIVNTIRENKNKTAFVFSSSCSVMGRKNDRVPLIKIDDDVHPDDNYTESKVLAEELIQQSGLDLFCIARLGAVMPTKTWYTMQMMIYGFEFPFHSRLEIVLDTDVATALVNAAGSLVTDCKVNKQTFFVGGGEHCRLYYGSFFNALLGCIGIPPVSKECFVKDKPSFLDWLDTGDIQGILKFQKHNFKDYLEMFKNKMRWVLPFTKVFGSTIGKILMKMSPYYKKRKDDLLENAV